MKTLEDRARRITSKRGASRQLATILREELKNGRYQPGDRLPTMQELVGKTNLGYSTVNRAVAMLANEGLVESCKGAGTYIKKNSVTTDNHDQRNLEAFALIVPEVQSGIYVSLQQGFDKAASKLHHQIFVCATDNDMHQQSDIIMQLIDKNVRGVVIVPTTLHPLPLYQIRILQNAGIPVVVMHRNIKGVSAPHVLLPFEDIGKMAGEIITSKGHRDIIILASHKNVSVVQYTTGFRKAIGSNGLQCHVNSEFGQYPEDNWEAEIDELIAGIFKRKPRPTAIVTTFDDIAEKVYLAALGQGIKIPEELSLVSFGSNFRGSEVRSKITAIVADEAHGGEFAAKLLDQIVQGKRDINDKEKFSMQLSVYHGETLGQPANSCK